MIYYPTSELKLKIEPIFLFQIYDSIREDHLKPQHNLYKLQIGYSFNIQKYRILANEEINIYKAQCLYISFHRSTIDISTHIDLIISRVLVYQITSYKSTK